MKKAIIISTLIATSLLSVNSANAAANKEQNIGFATGAVAGAAIGGPLGFILGGTIGVIFGDQVEKAGQLDSVNAELAAAALRENQLKEKITMMQDTLPLETSQNSQAQWVSEGLTLNLMFTTNSADLSDADLTNIERISRIMHQFPGLSLKLDGYSDPRGSQKTNMQLSQRRVDSVIKAFEAEGVSSERLLGIAHGEIAGLSNSADMDAFAMARKVSVNFIAKTNQQLAQN